MADLTPYVSDAHLRVMQLLETRGVELIEEVAFPPYAADIYVPSLHMVIEVDGPQHRASTDRKKDAVLVGKYHLFVLRVTHNVTMDSLIERFTMARLDAMIDSDERWERCRRKTPWL